MKFRGKALLSSVKNNDSYSDHETVDSDILSSFDQDVIARIYNRLLVDSSSSSSSSSSSGVAKKLLRKLGAGGKNKSTGEPDHEYWVPRVKHCRSLARELRNKLQLGELKFQLALDPEGTTLMNTKHSDQRKIQDYVEADQEAFDVFLLPKMVTHSNRKQDDDSKPPALLRMGTSDMTASSSSGSTRTDSAMLYDDSVGKEELLSAKPVGPPKSATIKKPYDESVTVEHPFPSARGEMRSTEMERMVSTYVYSSSSPCFQSAARARARAPDGTPAPPTDSGLLHNFEKANESCGSELLSVEKEKALLVEAVCPPNSTRVKHNDEFLTTEHHFCPSASDTKTQHTETEERFLHPAQPTSTPSFVQESAARAPSTPPAALPTTTPSNRSSCGPEVKTTASEPSSCSIRTTGVLPHPSTHSPCQRDQQQQAYSPASLLSSYSPDLFLTADRHHEEGVDIAEAFLSVANGYAKVGRAFKATQMRQNNDSEEMKAMIRSLHDMIDSKMQNLCSLNRNIFLVASQNGMATKRLMLLQEKLEKSFRKQLQDVARKQELSGAERHESMKEHIQRVETVLGDLLIDDSGEGEHSNRVERLEHMLKGVSGASQDLETMVSMLATGERIPCPRLVLFKIADSSIEDQDGSKVSFLKYLSHVHQRKYHVYFYCERTFKLVNEQNPMTLYLDRTWVKVVTSIVENTIRIASLCCLGVQLNVPISDCMALNMEGNGDSLRTVLHALTPGSRRESSDTSANLNAAASSAAARHITSLEGPEYDSFAKLVTKTENQQYWRPNMTPAFGGEGRNRFIWISNSD